MFFVEYSVSTSKVAAFLICLHLLEWVFAFELKRKTTLELVILKFSWDCQSIFAINNNKARLRGGI